MTPPCPTGSPTNWRRTAKRSRRAAAPWADFCASRCAMARIRTSRRPSMSMAVRAPASPAPSSFRARNCPTTISTTPTRPMNWWRSSIPRSRPPAPSSSMPIPAASPWARRLKDAYLAALACDTQSAFGGVLAFNQTLDGATAEEISKIFTEVIIAPDADEDAKQNSGGQEESAPADRGRPARSAGADPDLSLGGGRLPGPDPRQWPRHARRS